MPLLDLKTDLKSLKYGNDRPGGGNSGQPYQQVDINKVDTGFNRFRMTNFDDGLVRGGAVGAANASVVDTFRIGKFLKDFPKGPLFIVKQIGLQLSNPQLEHKTDFSTNRPTREQGLFRNIGNFVSNTANKILNVVGPTRIYNLGINTLAQVPVNAFGQHIVRHGFLPKRDDSNLYFEVAKHNNNEENNRLTKLREILGNTRDIANYISGPSSVYGIGKTLIRRRGDFININQDVTANPWASFLTFSSSPNSFANSNAKAGQSLVNGKRQAFTYIDPSTFNGAVASGMGTRNKFSEWNRTKYIGGREYALRKDIDYIEVNPNIASQAIGQVSSINDTSKENTIGKWGGSLTASADLGLSNLKNSQGSVDVFGIDVPTDISAIEASLNQNAINYKNPLIKKYAELRNIVNKGTSLDKTYITEISKQGEKTETFKTFNVNISRNDPSLIYNKLTKLAFRRTNDTNVNEDTLALQFTPLDPFTGNPLVVLKFLGYITDYNETYDSSWGSTKYVGRAENFYTFNEFKRTLSVGFNIPCFNPDELEQKHCNLSELASTLAGKYQNNLLLGGIITKLKVGRYVNDQPGIITNLTFQPIQDSSWDLDRQLAYYLKVSFGFTLIHNFLPQHSHCGFIDKKPDPIKEETPVNPTPEDDDSRTTTTTTIEVVNTPRTDIDSTLVAQNEATRQKAEFEKDKVLPQTKAQVEAARKKFESLTFSN